MTVELQFWQLILMLFAFFGCVAGFGKLLLIQFKTQLDQRFAAQEELRKEAATRWEAQFAELRKSNAAESNGVIRVERELLKLRAELPRDYVRREDDIRKDVLINAKLDALNARIDLWLERQQKGQNNGS